MSLSPCGLVMDECGRETVCYTTSDKFPIGCYQDDMGSFFVPWHWHEEFECILAAEGTVTVGVRGDRISLRPGEGLFINSGVLHNVDMKKDGPSILRSIVFHPRLIGGTSDSVFWQKLISPLLQDAALPYQILRDSIPWQRQFMELVHTCWHETVEETEDHENQVRYLLSCAFRLLNNSLTGEKNHCSRQDQTAAFRLKQMLQFIETHYTEDLTLKQIAGSASLSESACLRSFRQALNTTPIQYIRQLRLEKAAQLLLTTNRKVGQIALECGFSDVSYFTRTFREEKGVAPKAFRMAVQR